ncbi:unnamed protein product [Sympodiomycopsis kandeliae]
MGGRKLTAKNIKRKNAPTHPRSRRAAQLDRVALREARISEMKRVRDKSVYAKLDRISSLLLLLPDDWECLPDLPSLHSFLEESFLKRRDDELKEITSQRRPGRPPSKQELEVKESIEKDRRDYSENMEIPDLMNATNVAIMREWKGDFQSLGLFRMVRISGTNRSQYVVTQIGRHKDLEIVAEAEKLKQQQHKDGQEDKMTS